MECSRRLRKTRRRRGGGERGARRDHKKDFVSRLGRARRSDRTNQQCCSMNRSRVITLERVGKEGRESTMEAGKDGTKRKEMS